LKNRMRIYLDENFSTDIINIQYERLLFFPNY